MRGRILLGHLCLWHWQAIPSEHRLERSRVRCKACAVLTAPCNLHACHDMLFIFLLMGLSVFNTTSHKLQSSGLDEVLFIFLLIVKAMWGLRCVPPLPPNATGSLSTPSPTPTPSHLHPRTSSLASISEGGANKKDIAWLLAGKLAYWAALLLRLISCQFPRKTNKTAKLKCSATWNASGGQAGSRCQKGKVKL